MNSRIRRVSYPPGTVLDSIQNRKIISTSLNIDTNVGSRITINDPVNILILSEYPSPYLIIDRVFWWDNRNKNNLYPIYIRLIPRIIADESSVLVCKKGIDTVLKLYEYCPNSKSTFIREFMVDCVNEEFKISNPELAINSDEFLIPPIESYLNNNTIESLQGYTDLGYPWDVIYGLSPELDIYTRNNIMQPSQYADAIIETYLQVMPGTYRWEHPNMETVMKDFISPIYPQVYGDIAYDNFTKNMAMESSFMKSDIIKLGTILGDNLDTQVLQVRTPSKYEQVEAFSSHILQFCNWVHKLPYTECIGKYILPTKCRGNIVSEMLLWQYRNGPIVNDLMTSQMKAELFNIVKYWDTNIEKIEFVMTRLHELYLKIYLNGVIKNYYIDLSIATLLTQTLIRVA